MEGKRGSECLLKSVSNIDFNPVHEVYNVATGKQSSLLNIITDYQKVTDQSLSVEYLPARDGDIIHSCADITKLKGLDFNSKYTLFLGLSDYWVSASRN